MEEAKGGAGVRLCHDLKKHPLSLGRRDDLNAKEIEINDNLVSPSDEDGAIFLHVLYMRLYCLYVSESKIKSDRTKSFSHLYSPLLSRALSVTSTYSERLPLSMIRDPPDSIVVALFTHSLGFFVATFRNPKRGGGKMWDCNLL